MSPHPRAPLEGLRLGGGRGSRTGGRARVWALAVWVMGPPGCDDGGTKSDVAPDDDLDGDGFSVDAGDCDDADALVFPGASEACDGVDNNCDGAVDEGVTEAWFPDAFAGPMAGLMIALETGWEPDISGRDNLGTIALCEAVLRAASEHRAVEPTA